MKDRIDYSFIKSEVDRLIENQNELKEIKFTNYEQSLNIALKVLNEMY